jgi:hypothetical protein
MPTDQHVLLLLRAKVGCVIVLLLLLLDQGHLLLGGHTAREH